MKCVKFSDTDIYCKHYLVCVPNIMTSEIPTRDLINSESDSLDNDKDDDVEQEFLLRKIQALETMKVFL